MNVVFKGIQFELLGFLAKGNSFLFCVLQLVTEISIVTLLIGSLVGSMVQIGEVGRIGLLAFSSDLPNWLVGSYGRVIIALAVIFIVAPLCLVNQLRQVYIDSMIK